MANFKLVNTDQLDADMKSVADKLREKSQLGGLLLWPSGFIDAADQCSAMNFAVVGGTTRPSNPQENTIWINTSTAIPKWSISPKQPSSPSSGTVWIQTETDGDNAFNAIKNNEIYLILGDAKQYVSGTWKDVDAQLYTGGKWLQGSASSKGILYEPGNQHTDITGGWGSTGWSSPFGHTVKAPTISNSGITISGGDESGVGIAGTGKSIDLSKVNTLYVTVDEFTLTAPQVEHVYFAVNSEKKAYTPGTAYSMTAVQEITGKGEISLNVSGVNTGYVVLFCIGVSTSKIRATKIRME